jgi:hypothetical protein
MGCHQKGSERPGVRAAAEGGWILVKVGYIRELSYVDILFNMMEIIVMPIGGEGVGIE